VTVLITGVVRAGQRPGHGLRLWSVPPGPVDL